jgi:hypothetical protein
MVAHCVSGVAKPSPVPLCSTTLTTPVVLAVCADFPTIAKARRAELAIGARVTAGPGDPNRKAELSFVDVSVAHQTPLGIQQRSSR